MSHFDSKQADIKSRAPFSRNFQNTSSKIPRSETAAGTQKIETFPIPRVLYVRMYRKEDVFDRLSPTREDIVDDYSVDDEDHT